MVARELTEPSPSNGTPHLISVEPENASNGIVMATGSLLTLELDEFDDLLLIDEPVELELGELPESELELELPHAATSKQALPSARNFDKA